MFYSNNSSTPPYLFPTTNTTQGMYPLLYKKSLGLYHSFISVFSALGWPRISQLGTLGTLSCFTISYKILHKDIEQFTQQENEQYYYNPFYRHVGHISDTNIAKNWLPSSTTWMVLFPTLDSYFSSKKKHLKYYLFSH